MDTPPLDLGCAQLLLRTFDLERKTRIVDVGANPLSDPPYGPLLRAGGCAVVGFEPQKDAYEQLMRDKGPDEAYLPFAVGDGTTQTLHLNRASGLTSVFRPNRDTLRAMNLLRWANLEGSEDLQTVAMDADDRVGPFDLLKIDIQGGEVGVFRGAEAALKAATVVIVELRYYPMYIGEPMMGGVDTELRRQGFAFHKFLETTTRIVPNSQALRLRTLRIRDQAIDGDVVYLRSLETLPGLTDEQLKHLAVLSAGVFISHTLALHVLDILVARGSVDAGLPAAYVDAMPARLKR
ncbi:MAG: FkbM family methyltransferase [Rhodobacterales bacterium]|nr:FkbM family methyltransferase [Rhodobacterales bacterium]